MGLDLNAFLDEFRTEALEHLRALDDQLLALERDPANLAPIRAMFLAAHSLKGAGAMMDIADVEALAHAVEDVLARLRDGARQLDAPTADQLFRAVDLLRERVARGTPGAAPVDTPILAMVAALTALAEGGNAPASAPPAPTPSIIVAAPRAAAPPPAPPAELPADSTDRQPRVLLVEDSATVRLLHAALLTEAGFGVDSAADGQEALALFGTRRYALVVAGLETRGLRGPALAVALQRGAGASMPPFILTCNEETPPPPPPGIAATLRVASPARRQLGAPARALLGLAVAR